MLKINKIYLGDCLDVMKEIPDKSISMILCDLPYGTTACSWDTIIPFEPLWEQYKRIIKPNGAIVLTASQPFTSALVMSNIKMFKYEWIWDKDRPTGFALANKMPLKVHENILVFYNKQPTYNAQKWKGRPNHPTSKNNKGKDMLMTTRGSQPELNNPSIDLSGNKFPISIIYEKKAGSMKFIHPTQKPVVLCEYLIKTYTNEGDLVLDNCAGSGTTGVACINTKRNYILIEKEEEYCKIAQARIDSLAGELFKEG